MKIVFNHNEIKNDRINYIGVLPIEDNSYSLIRFIPVTADVINIPSYDGPRISTMSAGPYANLTIMFEKDIPVNEIIKYVSSKSNVIREELREIAFEMGFSKKDLELIEATIEELIRNEASRRKIKLDQKSFNMLFALIVYLLKLEK